MVKATIPEDLSRGLDFTVSMVIPNTSESPISHIEARSSAPLLTKHAKLLWKAPCYLLNCVIVMAHALSSHTLSASLHQTSRDRVRSPRAAISVFTRPSLCVRRVERLVTKAADKQDADLSGEWPVNWSLASYEDVGEFFKNSLFKEDAGNLLKDVMATSVKSVTPDTTLDSIGNLFDSISGVPVTKSQSDKTLVGVMSKKDLKKASAYDCLLASAA